MIVKETEKLLKKKANTCRTSLPPAYLIGSNDKITQHSKINHFIPLKKGLEDTVKSTK